MNIDIPDDVVNYVRTHFANCNSSLATDLSTFPAIHEESLDMNFISYFSRQQALVKLPSDWIIRIDAHFIGGGRHFGTWEVADIGLMMVFRHKGKVVRSKLSLLQSKKLYASNLKYVEESEYVRRFGLGRLIVSDDEHSELIADRVLAFTELSRYLAYKKGSDQQNAMAHFERRWGTQMYYLFYNPLDIPHAAKMPLERVPNLGDNVVGARVVQKSELDNALGAFDTRYSPSYADIRDNLPRMSLGLSGAAGWRLEDFASDLMLKCKAGLVDDSPNFESLLILMNQKQQPMSCALSITFDMQ